METAYFTVDTEQIDNLDELMARQTEGDERYAESVSWFDAVTTGKHFGRGLLMRANHSRLAELPVKLRTDPLRFDAPQLLTVPDVFPSGLLNRFTGKLFSEAWYRKSPTRYGAIQNITQFLHPLDVLGEWNRGYGPRGFLQYQFVVPPERGDVIRAVLERMTAAGQVSALNVLKRFGEGNRAPLSFPRPGWTLCVDMPITCGRRPAVRRAGPDRARRRRAALPGQGVADHAGGDPARIPAAGRVAQGPRRRRPGRCVRLRPGPTIGARLMFDAVGNPQSLLLLGGTSEIGLAIVEAFVSDRPMRVVLAGRESERLDAARSRLEQRGCAVETLPFDARELDTHADVVRKAFTGGDIDVAIVAFGLLGDNEQAWTDVAAAVDLAQVNYTAAVSVGVALAERMKAQGHGSLVALSSVAGERARRANFVYGSTKAGLDAFYTGLTEALREFGVRVTVVRPGFVHSRMTEGREPAPLATTPDAVAKVVVDAVRSSKEQVWAPPQLRPVMTVLRHLPRPIFRRLPG